MHSYCQLRLVRVLFSTDLHVTLQNHDVASVERFDICLGARREDQGTLDIHET